MSSDLTSNVSAASATAASVVLSQEQLQEEYLQTLRQALDTASANFFAAQTSLSPDAQKQFVSVWCESEARRAYRPNIVAPSTSQLLSVTGKIINVGDGKKKKVRGYIDGCYDIMHSGHYNAIRQAKSLCDVLVVGVHTNKEIEHHKGPPVMNDEERLAAVKACKWVDEVVFGVPYQPSVALLDELGCDFCVHGDDDATTADGQDAFAEAKAAGRMAIVKRTEGVSTTDLVTRLLAMTKSHHAPAQRSLASSPHLPATTATITSAVPDLALPPAHPQHKSTSSNPSPVSPAVSSSPSPQPTSTGLTPAVSGFLPTTWRISQFANHRVPKPTDKVVYLAGGFDLFHLGHVQRLEEARKLGDYLLVGVYDDATVNSYKGRNYPIMNVFERVLNVLSCKYVDEVVIAAPFLITKDLIKTLNISVVARVTPSPSSLQHKLQDPYAAIESLGIVKDLPVNASLQTADVIQRILDNRVRYEQRNAKRAVKEQTYAAKKEYVQEK